MQGRHGVCVRLSVVELLNYDRVSPSPSCSKIPHAFRCEKGEREFNELRPKGDVTRVILWHRRRYCRSLSRLSLKYEERVTIIVFSRISDPGRFDFVLDEKTSEAPRREYATT